ncbi:DUF2187 family protein [Niallia sp. XMNu-256]|uniref:DUF2187 family protein n=1 Tax=Niallia sp. XMNu-256 TaxID=3082444 RepID=UPI0030D064CA
MEEKKLANTGDKVIFHRKGREFVGEVVKVKEESVLVSVNQNDAKVMNIETPITVVSHKKYQLV